ncbi:hypothetical protein Y032_0052g2269 [Ancylostoma ceylanicum]|uniref:Uncharacterized protein n=1 Tax=Ancylostoma ceylanicum TaxID=53326 RepID=A0A016U781_9BILA|nr:hypothetical protein Y032_0052g2269 [Ancylostoma ceylanicum]
MPAEDLLVHNVATLISSYGTEIFVATSKFHRARRKRVNRNGREEDLNEPIAKQYHAPFYLTMINILSNHYYLQLVC